MNRRYNKGDRALALNFEAGPRLSNHATLRVRRQGKANAICSDPINKIDAFTRQANKSSLSTRGLGRVLG